MAISRSSIEAFLRTMLDEEFGLNAPVPASEDKLFSSGLLDSFDVLGVVASIEGQFNIRISSMDVSIERLDTISLIADFVESRI